MIGRNGWQVTLPDVWLGLWPETCRRLHAVLAKRRDRGGDWAELRVHGRRAEIDPVRHRYAIWRGIGVAGTAMVGIIAFGEPRTSLRLLCLMLIATGIVGLKLARP